MKKLISIILILTFIFIYVGCRDNSSNDKTESNTLSKPNDSSDIVSQEKSEDFSEMEVINNDKCAIKITDLEKTNNLKFEIKVDCENKSDDKKYMFSLDSVAVNGLQISSLFAKEVTAGKKAKEKISIYDSELDDYGFDAITDIELSFRVYDSEDLMAKDAAYETVNIYPFGKEKAKNFNRTDETDDVLLVDNNDIKAVLVDFDDDDIWGFQAELYLMNKTKDELMFSVQDVSVNGLMLDPLFAKSIKGNKSAFASISWSESSLNDVGIKDFDDINEIEMTFRVYDYNNILDNDIFNKKVTLRP